MNRNLFLVTMCGLVAIGCLISVGCTNERSAPDPSTQGKTPSGAPTLPIRVVSTVGMVADLVRAVGGERVAVQQLCGAGVDPHLYKVTRDDVQAMRSAEIVFYSGLLLEGKMTDTLVKLARDKPVVAVTEAIDPAKLLEPEDFAGHYDPHVWMDVLAWSECLDVIVKTLSAYDPKGAGTYSANAGVYREQLEKLHAYGKERLASIPESSRVLITSHDAFNYFGRAYGLEVLGVQGISTESEAGLQQVNSLVELLVERKIPAVFVESSVPRKNIEALVEGARSHGHQVTIGGELFSDACGAEGTYEGTYLGMLDHNITLVTRSLGGEAPETGLHGKLSSP